MIVHQKNLIVKRCHFHIGHFPDSFVIWNWPFVIQPNARKLLNDYLDIRE